MKYFSFIFRNIQQENDGGGGKGLVALHWPTQFLEATQKFQFQSEQCTPFYIGEKIVCLWLHST